MFACLERCNLQNNQLPIPMQPLSTLIRFRFIWLNLLFAAYLWLLQPIVLQRLATVSRTQQPDWLLGGLLLGVQFGELVALLLKRPAGTFFARQNPAVSQPNSWRDNAKVAGLVLVPILHIGTAAMLTLITFQAWGWMGSGAPAPGAWLVQPMFFLILIKEGFFVVLLISTGVTGSQHEQALNPHPTGLGARLNRWLAPPVGATLSLKEAIMDLTGDLLLLAFSTLTYTGAWEFITYESPLRHQGIERLWEYLGISLMFMMVYFTTRSVYLMQVFSIQQNRVARIGDWVSFSLVWAAALWGLH